MEISRPDPEVDRVGLIVVFRGQQQALGSVRNIEELTRGRACSPALDERIALLTRVHAFLNKSRDDMRRLRVKIIARAVQVDREEVNGVKPVLLAVGLALDEQVLS